MTILSILTTVATVKYMTILLSILTTVATVAIAFLTKSTYSIYKKMNESQDKFQNQLSDLYQAIVIATLISANSGSQGDLTGYIEKFKGEYKGETKIFKNQ